MSHSSDALRSISPSSILTHGLKRPEVGVLAGGSRSVSQQLAQNPDLHLFVDPAYGLLDIGRIMQHQAGYPELYRQVLTLLRTTEERARQSPMMQRGGAPQNLSQLIARTPHMKGTHLIWEINPRCAVLVYVRRDRSGLYHEINPITYVF